LKSLGHGKLTKSYAEDCRAVREILDRIGDKWSVLVIANLGEGKRRFNDLKRGIDGISQRMLTLTVRGLERDGLITRTIHPTIPPRVDYELTRLGRTLLEPVSVLATWAWQHRPELEKARERYDRTAAKNAARADNE